MYETTIAGIPALLRVTNFHPGHAGCYTGHPDFRCPKEYPEVEYEICDRSGYQADWLKNKLSEKDELQIEQDLIKRVFESRKEVY